MSNAMTKSFSAELSQLAASFKAIATWPSPETGLALHLLHICGCAHTEPFGHVKIKLPTEALDTAPIAATMGYAMMFCEPKEEHLSQWRIGLNRLIAREPFPRDRQTFAYRPHELVGLVLGVTKTESRSNASFAWLRAIIQELPNRTPTTNAWTLLLYHYAAALVGTSFAIPIPARLAEFESEELGLLVALLYQGDVFYKPEFEATTAQKALLEHIAVRSQTVRDVEKQAAIFGGLSLSLKASISAATSPSISIIQSNSTLQQSRRNITMKQKILFLAANPAGTTPLALDEECRQIMAKLRAADYRDSLELITCWAVRPDDLLQHLNEHRPHIVHFSGHGTQADEIVLLDFNRNPKPVPSAALTHLFTTLKDNIRVIVLNACFSKAQAEAITQVVDCAIGMNKSIGDNAAIAFASAFYQAIGFGRSVKTAFDSGKAALMLEGIPEEDTPELLCRTGVDPADIILVKPNSSQPSAK